jgi:DNA polymerase III sliding clamp (beta) subunit (PCNA family)
MQFTHNREQLLAACTIADGATADRSTKPILGCVKIAAEGETANQAQQTNATAILGRAGLLAQQVRSDGQTVAQNGDVNGQP